MSGDLGFEAKVQNRDSLSETVGFGLPQSTGTNIFWGCNCAQGDICQKEFGACTSQNGSLVKRIISFDHESK